MESGRRTGMRILLVEDETELARWVSRALEQGGFVIEHVADGLQAEARLQAEEYDAVLLDLRLPGKDGLSVLKSMRGREPLTKAQLLDKVFSLDADVSPDAIEVLVYRLRKKLSGHGVTIVTLRGFGYLLEPEAAP